MKRVLTCGVLSLACLVFLPACIFLPSEVPRYSWAESEFDAELVNLLIGHADGLYHEPRTPERVRRSFLLCEVSISRHDNYSGFWRAMRACAWLAENHTDEDERERYALYGVGLGLDAIKHCGRRPEPHYYYALCLGFLMREQGAFGGADRVEIMDKHCKQVLEIDEKFDSAGAHRFLGVLYLETEAIPFIDVGTYEDSVRHLERACELFPDYGYNQLALARTLLDDDEYDKAQGCLQRVVQSPVPENEKAEHGAWVTEAKELLEEIEEEIENEPENENEIR